MTEQLHGSVSTRANLYFDGKCVSHTVTGADGSKKSVGVILPSTLKFNTGAPEVMELIAGACRVRLAGSEAWVGYSGGQSFSVAGNTSFDIEATQALHYICHFG